MIKLLFLIVIVIAFLLIKLISVIVGSLSVLVDKRGIFINFGTQYLKQTKESYKNIGPFMGQIVDEVFVLSKTKHFSLSDETELLENVLYTIVGISYAEELYLLKRPQTMNKAYVEIPILSLDLIEKYNLKKQGE